jgi:hypothetical protein
MEETVSNGNDQLAGVMHEAAQSGDFAAPSQLVALIAALENPLRTLQDVDQAHGLFAAFEKDFGFIRLSFITPAPIPNLQIQPADKLRYVSLLRWLISELQQWRHAEDMRFGKLVAIFVAAQVCDLGNGLWALLPDEIADNTDLIDYLKELIASFSVAYNEHGGRPPRISEGEAVEKFKRADVEGDWVTLINLWQRSPAIFANTLQTQAVRFLYRYSFDGLIQATANLRQTAIAMQVADILTSEQRLRLAITSNNSYLQLASVYRTLTDQRGARIRQLADNDQYLLTELLLKVANDSARWAAWMQVFNAYPVRYPALQAPLGRALAKARDAAIDSYVRSIWLHAKQPQPDPGRRSVAECLREFCINASPERHATLWTLAHKRWLDWCFNKADPNQHVLGINWCDLDYALVAYATECMDEATRNQTMESIRAELLTLEHHWHESFTDILTSWNRLLSQFQPYAHATFVAKNGGDWLPETKTYLPFEPSQNDYLMMMYRAM